MDAPITANSSRIVYRSGASVFKCFPSHDDWREAWDELHRETRIAPMIPTPSKGIPMHERLVYYEPSEGLRDASLKTQALTQALSQQARRKRKKPTPQLSQLLNHEPIALRSRYIENRAPVAEHAENHLLQTGLLLASLHAYGMEHGDLKEANTLFDLQGHSWLIDFENTGSNVRPIGTYSAPEQVLDRLQYLNTDAPLDEIPEKKYPKSDVWAYGMMAFKMLSGHNNEQLQAFFHRLAPQMASLLPGVLDRMGVIARKSPYEVCLLLLRYTPSAHDEEGIKKAVHAARLLFYNTLRTELQSYRVSPAWQYTILSCLEYEPAQRCLDEKKGISTLSDALKPHRRRIIASGNLSQKISLLLHARQLAQHQAQCIFQATSEEAYLSEASRQHREAISTLHVQLHETQRALLEKLEQEGMRVESQEDRAALRRLNELLILEAELNTHPKWCKPLFSEEACRELYRNRRGLCEERIASYQLHLAVIKNSQALKIPLTQLPKNDEEARDAYTRLSLVEKIMRLHPEITPTASSRLYQQSQATLLHKYCILNCLKEEENSLRGRLDRAQPRGGPSLLGRLVCYRNRTQMHLSARREHIRAQRGALFLEESSANMHATQVAISNEIGRGARFFKAPQSASMMLAVSAQCQSYNSTRHKNNVQLMRITHLEEQLTHSISHYTSWVRPLMPSAKEKARNLREALRRLQYAKATLLDPEGGRCSSDDDSEEDDYPVAELSKAAVFEEARPALERLKLFCMQHKHSSQTLHDLLACTEGVWKDLASEATSPDASFCAAASGM